MYFLVVYDKKRDSVRKILEFNNDEKGKAYSRIKNINRFSEALCCASELEVNLFEDKDQDSFRINNPRYYKNA